MISAVQQIIRIVIVDDHPIVREGIKQIVSPHSDLAIVAEANNGEEALATLRIQPCDVVLLDISLPGINGVEVLKRIRAEHSQLQTLVLSIHPEEIYGMRVLRAGAAGYLTKASMTPQDLVGAIRKVGRGGRYITPTLAEYLACGFQLDRDRESARSILSEREYQTMCLLADGKTVTEIAVALSLSVKTISTYRTRILEKLHFRNNAELMRYAIKEAGVLSPSATTR